MYILGPLITECGSCGSADPGLPIDRSSSAPNDSTWISSRDSIACLGELSDHLISLRVKKIKIELILSENSMPLTNLKNWKACLYISFVHFQLGYC